MEKLLPSREPLGVVPTSYIHPPETRPGSDAIPVCRDVPVLDLAQLDHNRADLVKKLVRAGQDIGIFYLINHGIPGELIEDMLHVVQEFHELPDSDKEKMYSEDKSRTCRLYTSLDYDNEKAHFWRNILIHQNCQPDAGNNHCFPETPARFREVAGNYVVELRRVFLKLVDVLCEGIGIDAEHYCEMLTERQKMAMNYYPSCPDPSLALGLPKHDDINPMTILIDQSKYLSYQILRHGLWVTLDPPPKSLIVNFGFTFEVISNGKIKGDIHRVVLHEKYSRVAIAGSIHPADTYIVEPAKQLINEYNPPRYQPFLYKELQARRKAGFRDGQEHHT